MLKNFRMPTLKQVGSLFVPDNSLKIKGALKLQLFDAKGHLKDELEKDNLIVTSGFDFIADAIGKSSSRPAVMGWTAVGTSSTAPSAGQTLLISEIARVAATYAHTPGAATFTFQSTFNAGTGTGALTEAGIFNVVTANTITMLDRVTFSVVNKGASDTLTTTFTFTMS